MPTSKTKKIKNTSEAWIPSGFELVSHEDNGAVDLSQLTLHREPEQESGYIKGTILAERMKGKGLNSAVLKYLVDHPKEWPEEWKKDKNGNTLFVYFWGTIFRDPSSGSLYVRFGYWNGGEVVSLCDWLDSDWNSYYPAASLASTSSLNPKSSPSGSLDLESRVKNLEDTLTAIANLISKSTKG